MSQQSESIQLDTEDNAMRCILNEEGKLVFVSPALGWSVGQDAHKLTGLPGHKILNTINPAEKLTNMPAGFHEIALLRAKRDPLLVQARIDSINTPDNKKMTVIWLDPDNSLQTQDNNDISRTVQEWAQHVQIKKSPVPPTIQASDGELRHFLNITHDLLSVHHRNMHFARVNPAFCSTLGYTEHELKQMTFFDLVHPDDKSKIAPTIAQATTAPENTEVCVEFECRMIHKDKKVRRIEWIQKATGQHIYTVGHDVTRSYKRQAALKRREQQLSEAQKIAHMGHWYWEVRNNHFSTTSAMEWSDEIYSIFGIDREAFAPTIHNISTLVLKRDLGLITNAFQQARVQKKDYEIEFRIRRPNGSLRYVRCQGRCEINKKTGDVKALFGIMQDITDNTLHERALKSAKEAAESAYASKTRFLANMSHELRTPLNAIIGFSEMMQQQLLGPLGTPRYLDYISGIRESGEHLLDLINDILDMSKIEIGKYELYVEKLNIGKIIRLALHMVEGRAHEAQLKLVTTNLPDSIIIHADRRALMQILLNILSNAVKFTPAGGSIEISCQHELGGVVISVTDTGVGIPADKLDLVTLPFEQASSAHTRDHEGSGLGLAITKDLIGLHGGTLDIDSAPDIGTTVTIQLPEKIPETNNIRHATPSEEDTQEAV